MGKWHIFANLKHDRETINSKRGRKSRADQDRHLCLCREADGVL